MVENITFWNAGKRCRHAVVARVSFESDIDILVKFLCAIFCNYYCFEETFS